MNLFLTLASVMLITASLSAQTDRIELPGGNGAAAGLHVVFVSGDEEYRSEEALPQLARILSRHHGARSTVLFALDDDGTINPDRRDNIPGLEALESADLMVLFTRFRDLPDAQMKHIVDYVESGRPIIAIRTSTHAFAFSNENPTSYRHWTWNAGQPWSGGFGRQVLGETWVAHHGHHGSEATRGVVPVAARRHPIVRGVEDVWGPTDVYAIRDLPLDATVILEGSIVDGMTTDAEHVNDARNAPRMPVVWTRERAVPGITAPQRVVTSTIGAATDYENEDLRRIFVNACLWATSREAKIPERANVDLVGTYEPTQFGFGGFVKGKRPADYAPATSGDR